MWEKSMRVLFLFVNLQLKHLAIAHEAAMEVHNDRSQCKLQRL